MTGITHAVQMLLTPLRGTLHDSKFALDVNPSEEKSLLGLSAEFFFGVASGLPADGGKCNAFAAESRDVQFDGSNRQLSRNSWLSASGEPVGCVSLEKH